MLCPIRPGSQLSTSVLQIIYLDDIRLPLTSIIEIWLQWWTRANEQHPNAHVWYWLSVYAALGFFSLLTTFLGTWYIDQFFHCVGMFNVV